MRRRIEKGASASGNSGAVAVASVTDAPVPSATLPATSGTPADVEMSELSDVDVSTWSITELSMMPSALGEIETHSPESLQLRFEPEVAMDIRTGYDFNNESDRLEARERLRAEPPLVLIGSSRFVNFSQLQTFASDLKQEMESNTCNLLVTCQENIWKNGCFLFARVRRIRKE